MLVLLSQRQLDHFLFSLEPSSSQQNDTLTRSNALLLLFCCIDDICWPKKYRLTAGLFFKIISIQSISWKRRRPFTLDCLAFCFLFIFTDLAYSRKLEGQICADTVLCHIAAACHWRRIRKTSIQPAHLSGQMVPHHLPSHPQEADVRGSRSLPGIWKMSGLIVQPRTADPPPSQPFSPLSPLIPQASAQLDCTSGHTGWHLELEH